MNFPALAALPHAVSQPALQTAATAAPAAGGASQADIDRLRALVAGGSGAAPVAPAPLAAGAAAPEAVAPASMGDNILGNLVKFSSGYHESLAGIEMRLGSISEMDPARFGSDMADIVGLQVEVARWSMSVMGVDNASKAGTNTVKELSHGG